MLKIEMFVLFKPLYIFTLAMLLLAIVSMPFNVVFSTVLLLGIIALWGRVPCMFTEWIKDIELLDVCTFIVALNLGGLVGGLFGLIMMWVSKLFAQKEEIEYTIKDSIDFFVCGLLTPFFFTMSGGNVILAMYMFTACRWIVYFIGTVFIDPKNMGSEVVGALIGLPIAYAQNTLLLGVFGNYVVNMFSAGINAKWELVALAGAIQASALVVYKLLKNKEFMEVEPEIKRDVPEYVYSAKIPYTKINVGSDKEEGGFF